jgi:hypothetical protein
VTVTTMYLGIVDGLHTWEVRDESGVVIGKNESPFPPCPGPGWTLDEANCVWVQQETTDANV